MSLCERFLPRPRSEEEISELVRGAKEWRLEDSLALLDYPLSVSTGDGSPGLSKNLFCMPSRRSLRRKPRISRKTGRRLKCQVFKAAGHALFVDQTGAV